MILCLQLTVGRS
jgi:hypothetical protein